MANAALESELSNLVSVLSEKDSIIASQSVALESAVSGADSSAVSSAVSAAVDAEDSAVAGSISSILSAS